MSRDYPSDWDSRRRELYQRDEYTCQNCGARGGRHGDAELHAHHIVPISKGGTNKPSNLKTVCKECHDAIHGNRMAPSADDVTLADDSSTTDLEYPIDPAKYPYSITPFIECANAVVEVFEQLEDVSSSFGDLFQYGEMYAFVEDGDSSARLDQQYDDAKRQTIEALEAYSAALSKLEGVSADRFQPDKTENQYLELCDRLQTLTLEFDDYLQLLTNRAEGEAVSGADSVDLRLQREDIETTAEQAADAAEALQELVSREMEREMRSLDRDSAAHAGSMDHCPICGDELTTLSYTEGEYSLSIERCTDCRTEWLRKPNVLEVISSEYDIEGYSLAPAVWKKAYEEGCQIPDGLAPYQELSNRYVSSKKRYFALFGVLEVVIVLWAVSTGNLLVFLVATIVVAALAGGLFRRAKSKILVQHRA